MHKYLTPTQMPRTTGLRNIGQSDLADDCANWLQLTYEGAYIIAVAHWSGPGATLRALS